MTDQNNTLNLFTVLFVLFLTLKLTDSISWSWWWVFAPLWGPSGIAIALVLFASFLIQLRKVLR